MTNILVIPTTDWVKHPVPSRLNFIFDDIATRNNVYVLGFDYSKYKNNITRKTNCEIIPARTCTGGLSSYYIMNAMEHRKIISNAICEKNIDVILSANILPSYLAGSNPIPIVYDYLDVMHEAAAAYNSKLKSHVISKSVYSIVKSNLQRADKIITVSYSLRNYIIFDLLKDISRYDDIHVIPNGVDTSIFTPREKTSDIFTVGYVGSIEKWVDLETPIRAMKKIDGKLTIVGPPLHTNYIKKLKHIAAGDVEFKPAVPYTDLPEIINGFDIGLNPLADAIHNRYSSGGKIFNYLACGVPMLSTYFDPPYENACGAYWIYNNEDDFIEKAAEIKSTRIDRECLHRMSLKYNWKTIAAEYEKVLEDAASSK